MHAWGGSLEEPISQALGTKLDFTAASHLGCTAILLRSKRKEVLPSLPTPCGEVQRAPCSLNFLEEEKPLPVERLGARAVGSAWLLCDIILDLKIQDCLKTLSRLVGNHFLTALHKEPIN